MPNEIDIRKFRIERRWTQEKLASELGVNTSTVWRWENENKTIKGIVTQAIERLAEKYPANAA